MRQGRGTDNGRRGRLRHAARLIIPACAAMAIALGLPSFAAAAPAVAEHDVSANPARVAGGWDTTDLLAARPAPMPEPPAAAFDLPDLDASVSAQSGDFYPADPTAFPERLHGKVFFRVGENIFQCSGTLVNSRKGGVVYTAGHCVWDFESKAWVTNLVFIPGYENGTSPFNVYAATSLSSPQGFVENGDFSYDIGLVTVAGNPQSDLGGSRKIAFDQKVNGRDYTIYGYPALPSPPYDGQRLVGCESRVATRDKGSPSPVGVAPCNMKQGASGGGWITDGNFLNGVTSYTYCDSEPSLCGVLFGPYFSKAAKSLYTSATTGGSVNPSLKLRSAPPKKVRKRKVVFKFKGSGSTPVNYLCKFDRRKFVKCGKRTPIKRLSTGRHTLKVRSVDQTGRKSKKTIKRSFRVLSKRR